MKLLKVFMASVMALALNACTFYSTDTQEKHILIGISPDYAPYESKTAKGDLEGFDIDMTQWLFNYLNENGYSYSYEFVELSFDTIISSLQAGQIDLGISGFSYDEKREGIFSDVYYKSGQVLVVGKNSSIASKDDLKGKSVGAQTGSTGEEAANTISGANVVSVKDVKVLMEALNADGIDAVVLDRVVAENYVKNGNYKIVGEDLIQEENVIYTTKANQQLLDEINVAIQAFKESPEYSVLVEKWFS